jgi:cob(I)alamin adenosyltransferase
MRIYTRTGDRGETGLFRGPRVSKDHPRIEACGTVDELNAAVGLARAAGAPDEIDRLLCRVQHELLVLGGHLATPEPAASRTVLIRDEHVAALEAAIDDHGAALSPLEQFVLPTGTSVAAALHMARTICRRAERRVVAMRAAEPSFAPDGMIRYLNRLSDLLFVLARAANAAADRAEEVWQSPDVCDR